MSLTVPLVRAAALTPFLLWMRDRGLTWESRLQAAGLPATLIDEPERPVPLVLAMRFGLAAGRAEGPDIGCRVVSEAGIRDLATLSRVALGARTPRDAFKRLMRAMPHHSSHEHIVVLPNTGGITVRHSFQLRLDDETLHICQQYVAALIQSVAAGTAYNGPRIARISMTPHPDFGLKHLNEFFDAGLVPATSKHLSISLKDAVLDRPYLNPARDRALPVGETRDIIRGDGTLAASLRAILPGMLEDGSPSVAMLSALAGTSPRSLQRRLAAEGTSVSGLINTIRREQALARLTRGTDPFADIAAELGYSNQSSLTRAVRRWTAVPPSQIRPD